MSEKPKPEFIPYNDCPPDTAEPIRLVEGIGVDHPDGRSTSVYSITKKETGEKLDGVWVQLLRARPEMGEGKVSKLEFALTTESAYALMRLLAKKLLFERGCENGLGIYVIYEKPSDYPNNFVVRRQWIIDGNIIPEDKVILCGTLEEARSNIPPGMTNLGRQKLDDPCIVECWI